MAYIGKSLPVSMVASGKILPVFATEGERMDQAGFKRIGNGVVPLQAAAAFVVLIQRAKGAMK